MNNIQRERGHSLTDNILFFRNERTRGIGIRNILAKLVTKEILAVDLSIFSEIRQRRIHGLARCKQLDILINILVILHGTGYYPIHIGQKVLFGNKSLVPLGDALKYIIL